MRPTRSRLSVREGTTPLPALCEGVPRSLESALRSWIWETASLDSEVAQHALIRLDLVLPDAYWQRYQTELNERRAKQAALNAEWKAKLAARTEQAGTAYLVPPSSLPMPADPQARFLTHGTDTEILWDIVDDLLHELCIEPLGPDAPPLVVLRKWTATRRTKKITEPLRQLLEESRSVYEISPDQRGLRRRMDALLSEQVAMLNDIWAGHSDRHAGGPTRVPVSQEAAEAAFSVAVTLVNLSSKSAVRPRVTPVPGGAAVPRRGRTRGRP